MWYANKGYLSGLGEIMGEGIFGYRFLIAHYFLFTYHDWVYRN